MGPFCPRAAGAVPRPGDERGRTLGQSRRAESSGTARVRSDRVRVTELHDGWTVRPVGGPVPRQLAGRAVPARVPGSVHLDLLAAGLIPDPYLGDNEAVLTWIGEVDWRFETTLVWDGTGEHVDLVADGLDTLATVEFNGGLIGRTANMHRTYRFPVRDRLRRGANRLAITFAAARPAAERLSAELGPRPHANAHPFNAMRKM